MTTHVAPAEAHEYFRTHTEDHITRIVQMLSLQPEDSLMHNVEAYKDGLRVPVTVAQNITYYVYLLPWMRGWSLFTSPLTNDVAAFSWRTVPARYKPYQMPLYAPRDQIGPWTVSVEQITAAYEYIVRRVSKLKKGSSNV